jgi:hypothetical protein
VTHSARQVRLRCLDEKVVGGWQRCALLGRTTFAYPGRQ